MTILSCTQKHIEIIDIYTKHYICLLCLKLYRIKKYICFFIQIIKKISKIWSVIGLKSIYHQKKHKKNTCFMAKKRVKYTYDFTMKFL